MPVPTDLRLDSQDIEERGILRTPQSGTIASRIGILLSIYFLEGWRRDKRQALLQILENYLSLFSDKITHFRDTDGRTWLPRSGAGLPESYRSYDTIDPDENFSYHMFRFDPQERDDTKLWRIMAHAFPANRTDRPLSGLKVHFPPGYVLADPNGFVELIRLWCRRLGALHGSSGLGVLTEVGRETSLQTPYHYLLLKQYPALEYDAMGNYWVEVDADGFERPRSSNWLTVLGEDNLQALGGIEKVRSSLQPNMDLVSYNSGVVIRAGHLPALGNEETGGIPEAYRTVARLIEPIRFEGYRWGIIKPPEPLNGLDVTLAWIRRFD
jgi:hypothetical protein